MQSSKGFSTFRLLTDAQIRILLRRNPHGLGEGLEEAAVIAEAALLKGIPHAVALVQMGLRDADAAGGDVLVDGGAGGLLEDAADVGLA